MGKQAGKIALGLGLITGALTGLLFAPDEGKNIRKKIATGDTKGLLDDLEGMGEELKQIATEIVRNPGVHHLIEKGKDLAADTANLKREELDQLLHSANRKAEAFKSKVAAYVKEQKAILEANGAKKGMKKTVAKKSLAKKSAVKKPVVQKPKSSPAKKTTVKKKR
jgi:gas vesicle protein